MTHELILEMIKISSIKELILFDRGYPGSELISKLIDNNIHFVMRLSTNLFKKSVSP